MKQSMRRGINKQPLDLIIVCKSAKLLVRGSALNVVHRHRPGQLRVWFLTGMPGIPVTLTRSIFWFFEKAISLASRPIPRYVSASRRPLITAEISGFLHDEICTTYDKSQDLLGEP